MLRFGIAAALVFAVCASASAQEQWSPTTDETARPEHQYRRDGFVITNDACGASRYAHLLGENYAELHQASLLPADTNVVGQRPLTTLEFKPEVLNVVLDGAGRVVSIGCF
jgi:hypothetical protein